VIRQPVPRAGLRMNKERAYEGEEARALAPEGYQPST
jgi:hypothetical protein